MQGKQVILEEEQNKTMQIGHHRRKKKHLRERWMVRSMGQTTDMGNESVGEGTLRHQKGQKKKNDKCKWQMIATFSMMWGTQYTLSLLDPTHICACSSLFTFHMEFILAISKLTLKKKNVT